MAAVGAIATAAPASADDQNPGGAQATLNGLSDKSGPAVIDGGHHVQAGLFDMTVDGGGTLQTYCIDINNPTQKEAKYQESGWDATSLHDNADAGKILWILENSYPQVDDLAQLASKAKIDDGLDEKQAAAGTQVAIWRFSDHADVEAQDPNAEKLADWLQQSAQSVEEPKPSLTLDPAAVSGKSGAKLGPVTVNTSASSVQVGVDPAAAAKKVGVVNKDGQPVTTAANGDQLFFDVPAGTEDGTASLSVKATTTVPVGRAFSSLEGQRHSQTQILAGSSASTVEATATGTWAAADHKGPIPAVSADKNCAEGGVDVTATNEGDEDFTFELADKKVTVAPGKSETVLVPVKEDQPYEITVALPGGKEKTFTGVLDCKTSGGGQPSSQPSPATAGGSTTGGGNGDLAETGSSSATPVIAGVAIALVVLGGGTVFFLRKRKSSSAGE